METGWKINLNSIKVPERFYRDRRRLEERARSELKIGSGAGVNEVVNLTNCSGSCLILSAVAAFIFCPGLHTEVQLRQQKERQSPAIIVSAG